MLTPAGAADVAGPAIPPGRAPWGSSLTSTVVRTPILIAGILVLYYLLPLQNGFHWRTVLALAAGLAGVTVLVAWQARRILLSRHPALRAIEALALILPLFLVLFAAAYAVLAGGDPHAFTQRLTRTDTLYFVVTVFSTVGFGDIAPVSEAARVLAMAQMLGDLLLIGLALRVLLNAVQRGRERTASTAPTPAPPPD